MTIDGKAASADGTGAWQAEGWDGPGSHLIDLTPGPSLSYEIVADPANREGWPRWQSQAILPAHKELWTRTSICGASILGVGGEAVLAHEAKPTLIALGSRGHATPFQKRSDANVSIALTPELPAFLLVTSGIRTDPAAGNNVQMNGSCVGGVAAAGANWGGMIPGGQGYRSRSEAFFAKARSKAVRPSGRPQFRRRNAWKNFRGAGTVYQVQASIPVAVVACASPPRGEHADSTHC